MGTYAATVNVKHLSTSQKARNSLSVSGAVGKAKANLAYATRETACDAEAGDLIHHSAGKTTAIDRDKAREIGAEALAERSLKHNDKYGVRLCDKLVVSLPDDATPDEHRKMVGGILSDLGGQSSAHLVGAIHRDRAGNPHAHIWAVDGKETREMAQARNPEAKRIRQADHLNLNEGGNRQDLRARVAEQINAVSRSAGRKEAEIRSLNDQGVQRVPQAHEGVEVADKADRKQSLSQRALARVRGNIEQAVGSINTWREAAKRIPRRWRKQRSGQWWAERLEQVAPEKTPRQAEIPDPSPSPAPPPKTADLTRAERQAQAMMVARSAGRATGRSEQEDPPRRKRREQRFAER